ncbi:acetoacetate decarboxylase [Rhodococcus sp. MS16]|uniref:acetoacetate decarboxylase family protein n=1 Tax=Rhodococcus sp. MS16 TaxID=2579941 RepID=UPI001562A9D1|nr:acetoacetate decarboxylase family protein [Rhodococcus sp. MS16]NRI65565.1 acetoacetate decarboxylase [Rhodococcus sp. MS16]
MSYTILGKTVEMPVEVRTASAFMAMFSVPSVTAQSIINHTGLTVLQFRPGRALCGLVFVDYVDGDLGPYNEFGVTYMVRSHTAPPEISVLGDLRALTSGTAGALIHELPVDGEFTKAAGREIWGFPKVMAEFDTEHVGSVKRGSVSHDGKLIAQLSVKSGVSVPGSGANMSLAAYSHLDGITRCTSWDMAPTGVKSRPGGAELQLGTHPMAAELRRLGLPKRALMTTTITNLSMTFGEATTI